MARMELPVMDKFCFIFDLKTGCMFLGIANSVLTFILAVVLIAFAVDIKSTAEFTKKEDLDAMSGVVYTIIILMVVLVLVKFILDLIFVYSVYKGRASIMKKYCIFWIVFLVLYIIGFLKTLFHMNAGHVISQIMFLAENFYFVCIIRSYLISINEEGVL